MEKYNKLILPSSCQSYSAILISSQKKAMTEWGWILVFIIFIILIIVIWYAFSGGMQATNPNPPVVGANNGGVVFQPGVGYVASNGNVGTTQWTSGMIIIAVIVFIIIIALIIWAVYPRRTVVIPPPLPPVIAAPLPPTVIASPPVNVSMPQQYPPPPQVTEYHHYMEPIQQAYSEPTVAPVAAPPMMRSSTVAVGSDRYGLPTAVSSQVVGQGQARFDPDPKTTLYTQPGYDTRTVVNHSELGTVSGVLHHPSQTVAVTNDVQNHQVMIAGQGQPTRGYIGAGVPQGYRRVSSTVVRR
ncbi:Hypothetical protein POVR2_LOCUS227 [uncultured virus]|nr:Hypothetical protein POVR2_LOCUS227 [uncultured virus]